MGFNTNQIQLRVPSIVSTDYIKLTDTNDDINWVTVQIWWSELNAFDGKLKLAYNKTYNAPYVDIPDLEFDIDNFDGAGGGSCIFTYTKYKGASVGLNIDLGTATVGTLFVWTRTDTRTNG